MRKTFKFFCAVAVALLAVSSCGKIWDEFDNVNQELDKVNQELAELKAKVAELENKLNADVAAINEALGIKMKFQVDPETLEVSVSYDNGATWVETGILCNDATVAVDYEDGADYLTLVVGGAEYAVSIYQEDNSSIVPGRADFFLRYEGTKKVELTATDMAEVYVMAKPNGWKAVLEENVLTVTAPTKAAVEIGAAETEGEILIHATTADGKCKVAKVEVTAGPGLTLAVDSQGNVTIENSYSGESMNMWGEVSFGFSEFVFGLATPEDFNADPVKYVETYNSTWQAPNYMDIIFPSLYNVVEQGQYVEGEYETDIIKTTVSDIYYSYMWDELPAGSHFVLWASPAVGSEGQADLENIVYVEYVHLVHEVAVVSSTHSDATITANVAGASSYLVGYVNEADYAYMGYTFADYMQAGMGGPWSSFVKYGAAEALGMQIPAADMPAEFNLSDIFGEKLAFGASYKVWVMPLLDHKNKFDEAQSMPEYDYYVWDYSAYDFEADFMPYVFDVKTNDIVAGGEYEATLEMTGRDYKNIYVTLTPSEGTESVYYVWYSAEEYEVFENDSEVMADLFANCYSPATGVKAVNKTYVNPGEDWVLATVSIGTDGKYGPVVSEKFSTLAVPYSEDITVEVVSAELDTDGKNYTVTVKVAGGAKVMGYNITHSDYNFESFPVNVAVNGHKASYSGYQMADVVDGQAVLTFAKSSYKKDYYVAAYNVENNVVSAISATCANVHLFD